MCIRDSVQLGVGRALAHRRQVADAAQGDPLHGLQRAVVGLGRGDALVPAVVLQRLELLDDDAVHGVDGQIGQRAGRRPAELGPLAVKHAAEVDVAGQSHVEVGKTAQVGRRLRRVGRAEEEADQLPRLIQPVTHTNPVLSLIHI